MRMLSDSPGAAAHAPSSPPQPLLITATSASVVPPQPPAVAGSDASFDADMVIILAAMLCILVCAICLNSLVTCFRRIHSGSAAHAAAAMMAAVPAGTDAGLKKRELRRIPVVVYEAGDKAGGVSAATEECTICLGEFEVGDKVRVLPRCNHGFHVQCIDIWLATHPSCPICRNSLLLLLHDERGGEGVSASEEKCAICLGELEDGDKVQPWLPC